ncbi:hypothetical protein [Pseudomonas fluorescens]|uniref:Uncharacterized protein n=1 Tax=Pseudomonas fluorescens TaxID=294 RepID=A0A5E7EZZ1_PSEFL|nr:hypothetical protein [Pseudomonas fluorescens]VVO32102.1 hypothetical protein PS691_05025 [Pseudomonas fluorescens]
MSSFSSPIMLSMVNHTAVQYPLRYSLDAPADGTALTLRQVLEQDIFITPSGYMGTSRPHYADHRREAFRQDFVLEFDDACRVLATAKKVKVPTLGSYGLKHVAERLVGNYVSNGALICAAIALGFTVDDRGSKEWPNALIGVSRMSLREWDAYGLHKTRSPRRDYMPRGERPAGWDFEGGRTND